MGDDFTAMREAAARLEAELGTYPGVLDIGNDFRPGKMEIQLALKPAGRVLGITLADLARQVNQGFHGAEALRLQRGRDDVRVMIRYPEAERRSLGDLDNVRIRTPKGGEVPFGAVAAATLRRGFTVIKRADRQRALNVTAEVDSTRANAEKILADLEAEFPAAAARRLRKHALFLRGPAQGNAALGGQPVQGLRDRHAAGVRDPGGDFPLLRASRWSSCR